MDPTGCLRLLCPRPHQVRELMPLTKRGGFWRFLYCALVVTGQVKLLLGLFSFVGERELWAAGLCWLTRLAHLGRRGGPSGPGS